MAIDPSIPLGVQQFKFNSPFEQLGQIREQQQRRQINEQAIRSNQALEEDRRNKIAKEQRLAESTQVIDGLMDKAMVQDPETGIYTFDRGLAEQSIVKANQGHRLPEYMQHFDELDKSTREAAEKRNTSIAKALMVVTTSGNTPGSAQGMIAYLKKNRLMSEQESQGVLASLAEDETPEHVAAIVKKYGEAIPQYRELLNAEETRKGVVAKSAADLAKSEADTAKTIAETGQIGRLTPDQVRQGSQFATTAAETARHNRATEGAAWLSAKAAAAKPEAGAVERGRLVAAVLANPNLWDDLTPTEKGKIAPDLNEQGYTGFGKPLPPAAVAKVSGVKSAIDNLRDLKTALKENEQYIGPVAGLQRLNPWSDARKLQAKVDVVRQRVGKSLEEGVLRKEDEEKYKIILAEMSNTPELAYSKIDGLTTMLENDLTNYLGEQRLAGRRVQTTPTGRPGAPAASGPATKTAPAVGATVTYNGKRYRVTGISKGQADLEPLP